MALTDTTILAFTHSGELATIEMVVEFWVLILTVILIIIFIISLCLIKIAVHPNKTDCLTVVAVSIYVISAICSCIHALILPSSIKDYYLGLLAAMTGFSWLIAQILVDMLLIIRLKHAFIETKYETKKITIMLLNVTLALFAFVGFTKTIIFLYESITIPSSNSSKVYSSYDLSYAISNTIMAIIDLILSISLIYLFVSKLILIAVQSVKNNIDSLTNYYNQQNKQILSQLLNVAVKYMILASISVTATQILIIYWTVRDYVVAYTKDATIWVWGVVFENMLWPIEILLNSICIILYLPKTDKIYNK